MTRKQELSIAKSMPHKKVLLATRPLVPPWDEASKNFAYFLGREVRDHDLTLLTTNQHLGDLPSSAIEQPLYQGRYFGFFEKLTLLNYLQTVRQEFDITHYLFTPTWINTALIKYLAHPKRGKTVQTVATLREDLYSDRELESMLFADRLVVYTDKSKQKIESLGFHNVERIYPGIDLVKYAPQPKFDALLQSFGLTQEHFIVMYPGEYTRLGATDMLTNSLITYFQNNPTTNMRFLFACRIKTPKDAKKKEWVKHQFEKAGVSHFVQYTDTIADMPSLYNLADVVVFPVENLKGKFDVPLVIIEAYACGKPVILTDLPEFEEFSNQNFSVIIPKNSGDELIRSLTLLEQDIPFRQQLGVNARAFVEDSFDLTQTAARYSELYSSL